MLTKNLSSDSLKFLSSQLSNSKYMEHRMYKRGVYDQNSRATGLGLSSPGIYGQAAQFHSFSPQSQAPAPPSTISNEIGLQSWTPGNAEIHAYSNGIPVAYQHKNTLLQDFAASPMSGYSPLSVTQVTVPDIAALVLSNQLDKCYAYALDRGSGQYTRLVPADHLPPMIGLPRTQGPEELIILPTPRGTDHFTGAPQASIIGDGWPKVRLNDKRNETVQVRMFFRRINLPHFCTHP